MQQSTFSIIFSNNSNFIRRIHIS